MSEVAMRRSRSARLSELAEQLGIVAARSSVEAPVEDSEPEELEAVQPAFDELEIAVSEGSIQEDMPPSESAGNEGPLPTEIPADPRDVNAALAALTQELAKEEESGEAASELEETEEPKGTSGILDSEDDGSALSETEPVSELETEMQNLSLEVEAAAEEQVQTSQASSVHVSDDPVISFAKLDAAPESEAREESEPEADQLFPQVAEEVEASTVEPEAESTPPATPEEAIVQSDPFLDEEPQLFETLESEFVAEKLVDQVGEIVNIQRLPKTQPSRVLSKTKAQEKGGAKPIGDGNSSPTERAVSEPKSPEQPKKPSSEAEGAKPKKKRVSLLDSYFKGM